MASRFHARLHNDLDDGKDRSEKVCMQCNLVGMTKNVYGGRVWGFF